MKKQLLTYFFFTVYLLAMLKPMLPIIDYYVNYSYIAAQLCENKDKPILDCNGKCYVAKEIEKNSKSNNQDTIVPEFKIDLYLPNATALNLVEVIFIPITKKVTPSTKETIWQETFLFSIFHPPKFTV